MERRNVDGLHQIQYLPQLNRNADQRFFGYRGKNDIKQHEGLQIPLEDHESDNYRNDLNRLDWNTLWQRRLINDAFR